MKVSAINVSNLKNNYKPQFGNDKKSEYENPINRNTERNLAILSNVGASALAGATAAGIASCFVQGGIKQNKKLLAGVGVGSALAAMALTLPSKLYNTKVNAFTREKETDVFSRDRELKSNIMEEVNKEVKDEDVDLDQKINHYTSVQMANNGRGMLLKGA